MSVYHDQLSSSPSNRGISNALLSLFSIFALSQMAATLFYISVGVNDLAVVRTAHLHFFTGGVLLLTARTVLNHGVRYH